MKRSSAVFILLLVTLVTVHVFSTRQATAERRALSVEMQTPTALPGPLLRVSALEFKNVLADFLFLKGLVFIGASDERTTVPKVSADEWQWLLNLLTSAADLDPMFIDTYYFANANLVWDGHLVRETNTLLDRARESRPWDWLPPFYMGFNCFYFLDDDAAAINYLTEASRRPDAPPGIASLVVRLSYKSSRTESAILFLQELLAQTEDQDRRKDYQLRLQTLSNMRQIELAVAYYTKQYARAPVSVDDLIKTGILQGVPADPYGGKFYLDTDGRVRTSSDMRFIKKSN